MFAFDKYVTPFLTPLGGALLLAVLVLVLLAFRRTRLAFVLLFFTIVALYLTSTPVVATALSSALERDFPPTSIADTPVADTIIVLGGATDPALPPRQGPELGNHGQRLVHAADLYRAGKAKWIIASGGSWTTPSLAGAEADDMRAILIGFGVPAEAILLQTASVDTGENARLSAVLMQERHLDTALLVTSGVHMPRAMASFRRAGINVTASTADIFAVQSPDWPVLKWLPSPNALVATGEAMHELAGMFYYRLRGWA